MLNGLSLDTIVDVLAEKLAERLERRLAPAGNGAAIRPRLLTVEQAAVYIGRSKEAMQHMVTDGKIPTVRSDRRIFIDVRDLDAWIEENKRTGLPG